MHSIEWWNTLNGKRHIKILESNPWACIGDSKNPTLCLRALSERSLSSVSTALWSLFSAWPSSGGKTFSCYAASTSLTQLQGCSLGSCHFFRCSLSGEIKATSPFFGGNRRPWPFKYLDYLFFLYILESFLDGLSLPSLEKPTTNRKLHLEQHNSIPYHIVLFKQKPLQNPKAG